MGCIYTEKGLYFKEIGHAVMEVESPTCARWAAGWRSGRGDATVQV